MADAPNFRACSEQRSSGSVGIFPPMSGRLPTLFAHELQRLLLCASRCCARRRCGAADFRARAPEDEVIYFLLPDRFENGDRSNDRGGLRAIGCGPASIRPTKASITAAISKA